METSTVTYILLWSAVIVVGAYIIGFARGYDAGRARESEFQAGIPSTDDISNDPPDTPA